MNRKGSSLPLSGPSKRMTGGCLCGDVRFEVEAPVQKPHTCSCRICQRHTGALTLAWVEFAKDDVEWNGPGGMPTLWRSSEFSSRAFCPACGSSLGAVDDEPVVALLVGAFDVPKDKALIPTYHSYRSSAPRWWCVQVKGIADGTTKASVPPSN